MSTWDKVHGGSLLLWDFACIVAPDIGKSYLFLAILAGLLLGPLLPPISHATPMDGALTERLARLEVESKDGDRRMDIVELDIRNLQSQLSNLEVELTAIRLTQRETRDAFTSLNNNISRLVWAIALGALAGIGRFVFIAVRKIITGHDCADVDEDRPRYTHKFRK
jgi:hypothetical protein